MNTVKKGNNSEKLYKDILEKKGYEVIRAFRYVIRNGTKFMNLRTDFFGKFDLIGIKEDDIVFVQVTSIKTNKHTHKEITDFADKYKNPNITYILAKYDKENNRFEEFIYKYKE